MPIVDGIAQNTTEWLIKRIGCGTSSHAADMIDKLVRSEKESARRRNYREEIELERELNRATERKVSPEMWWGITHQDEAAKRYEVETGLFLTPGGFWLHHRIRFFGASPDYLLPDGRGLVEIKCPLSKTHRRSFKYGEVDQDYIWQMAAQMSVCQREYVDFVSYDPRFPKRKDQFWMKRFTRDDPAIRDNGGIAGMELEIEQFLLEVERNTRGSKDSLNSDLVRQRSQEQVPVSPAPVGQGEGNHQKKVLMING
jgi:hypothetical protein